jgi:hypothetical protein
VPGPSAAHAPVLAHRGLLDGPDPVRENTLATLRHAAQDHGHGLELDVRGDGAGHLVLTHDPAPWRPETDAVALLADPPGDALHALNVKDPAVVPAILDVLVDAGTLHRFFLFDFELACATPAQAAALATTCARRGAIVARRLSDRERVLDAIVADAACAHVWLDELDGPWVDGDTVAALTEAGKHVWYVSPDLHRREGLDTLPARWARAWDWGVTGICTDYATALTGATRTTA